MTTIDNTQSRTAGRWTKQEHEKFLYGLKIYGKNWKKIQDLIQTRTSTQIRSHAQKFFIKRKKNDNFQDDSENLENSTQNKFSQQTIVSPCEERQVEKQISPFSFYFEKIINNYAIYHGNGQQFNFWNSLIDCPKVQKHSSCEQLEIPNQFDIVLKRNFSHKQGKQFGDSESATLFRTQFSCFEQYQNSN